MQGGASLARGFDEGSGFRLAGAEEGIRKEGSKEAPEGIGRGVLAGER